MTAILVKNEADKFLERVIRRYADFSDETLVLDDGSTDGSVELARRLGCGVKRRAETGMWGNEAPARAELWDWGSRVTKDGWLLIGDADMVLHGDPRPLTYAMGVTAWSWVLYDMWAPRMYYRTDGFWQGHLHPRPWMFRPRALTDAPAWPARGLHTGHCPVNFPLRSGVMRPTHIYWEHLAYSNPDLRRAKHAQYLSKTDQLSAFELVHAHSILDAG